MVSRPELLKDKAVVEEINKHKWIESQKLGYDIGFEKAAQDWISRFADDWETSHEPKRGMKLIKKGKRER